MSKTIRKTDSLVEKCGEMWPRNDRNIENIPRSKNGGKGIYVLFDGSTPVYIGRGNIHQRIRKAKRSQRRGQSWDHFSWYVVPQKNHEVEIEALLLRMLPPHLRMLNQQSGKLPGARSIAFQDEAIDPIVRPHIFGGKKRSSAK